MSGRCGVENSEQSGPVGPGEMLRQAREAQGISVREMADRLNWLPAYVEDIEDNQFERLRGTVFVRGYLRTYGKCLGVSETALMSALAEMNLEADLPAANFPLEAAPRVWQTPAFSIGVGIIVAALVALLFWRWQGSEQTATVVPPAVTEVERQANSPVELEPVAVPATNPADATEMDAAAQAVSIPVAAQPQADTNGEADTVAAASATNSGDATEMDAAAQAVGIAAAAPPQTDTNGQADTVAATPATDSGDATEMDAAAQAVGIAAAAPPQTDTNGQADTVAVVLDRDSTGPPIELAAANAELTFRFDGDCWLEVRNADDELIYADLRREGDQLQLDGAAPFHILVGDARMVELYFRGEPFAIRPRPGRVMARFTVGE